MRLSTNYNLGVDRQITQFRMQLVEEQKLNMFLFTLKYILKIGQVIYFCGTRGRLLKNIVSKKTFAFYAVKDITKKMKIGKF